MKTMRKVVRLFFFTVMGTLMTVSQGLAEVSCHKINAKGVGQDLGGGMTTARIIGGGLLQGTTAGNFIITDDTTPPVLLIAGTVEFTTNKATLTVTVEGFFDVATGDFSTSGPVTDATGKLEEATGNLTLEGIQDLSTGEFVEDVKGLICVDLAP